MSSRHLTNLSSSSSWMSPRPPRSVTQLKCKNLSGGFKYVTCAACPSYWQLASHLWWRSLSSTYAVPSPPQLSPPEEVGTLISGIRRFLLLARAMEAECDDHVPHLRALRRIHQSWPESAGGATLWPSAPPTASAYFNSFGIAGIGQPKTRRLVVHASRQHVSSRVRRIADSIRRVLGTVPTSARSQPIWTPCLLNVTSRSSNRSSSGSAFKTWAHTRGPTWWGRNRFLATYPRHPRTSTTRTMVQRLQERAYFLRTTCAPVDTGARLDSLVELAPVLLASAPLPPPTPTPTFLQWD